MGKSPDDILVFSLLQLFFGFVVVGLLWEIKSRLVAKTQINDGLTARIDFYRFIDDIEWDDPRDREQLICIVDRMRHNAYQQGQLDSKRITLHGDKD